MMGKKLRHSRAKIQKTLNFAKKRNVIFKCDSANKRRVRQLANDFVTAFYLCTENTVDNAILLLFEQEGNISKAVLHDQLCPEHNIHT